MMLFRSEEEVDAWSRRAGRPQGAIVPMPQLQRLATAWYGDRLDPRWRPRTTAMSQALLTEVGLTGDLWRLA